MIVRRYEAKDLPEALRRVRQELGPEAVMLSSEVLSSPSWQFWRQRKVAVTASDAYPRPSDRPAARASEPREAAPKESADLLKAVTELGRQVAQLSRHLDEHRAAPQAAAPVAAAGTAQDGPALATRLAESGLTPTAALAAARARQGIGLSVAEAALAEGALAAWLEARRDPDPWAWRTVALVGPTGAGKTTTLAKMAAHVALERGERVALVTLDTYRVAALDQLRTYAEILSVPFRVAYDGDDLARAVEEQADADRVFIDTPGRNFANPLAVAELAALIRRGAPDAVEVVVPAAMAPEPAERLVRAFSRDSSPHLVVSKWDEQPRPDPLLPCLLAMTGGWGLFGNGQIVPEDLAQPSAIHVARALLGLEAEAA